MRIVDHRQFAHKRRKFKLPKGLVLAALVAVAGIGVWFFVADAPENNNQLPVQASNTPAPQVEAPVTKSGKLKTFTGEQFKTLARGIRYPNVQEFTEPPFITGDPVADARIRSLAEARGYKLTSIPVGAIQKINEPRLEGDDLLQPLAALSWTDLKAAAKKDSVPLSLLSAYRSPDYQRTLFMSRLLAKGTSIAQIAAGQGDAAVTATLGITAVPGYSRHHTGYTIDLWCEDGSGSFLASRCYKWISESNYQKAKEAGWIPSYPDGAGEQGPEPEPWEYIWVGKEAVTE